MLSSKSLDSSDMGMYTEPLDDDRLNIILSAGLIVEIAEPNSCEQLKENSPLNFLPNTQISIACSRK